MAKMLFDETRALRREQREARIARKRDRRAARTLKHRQHTIGLETLTLETIEVTRSRRPAEEPPPAAETVAAGGRRQRRQDHGDRNADRNRRGTARGRGDRARVAREPLTSAGQ